MEIQLVYNITTFVAILFFILEYNLHIYHSNKIQ